MLKKLLCLCAISIFTMNAWGLPTIQKAGSNVRSNTVSNNRAGSVKNTPITTSSVGVNRLSVIKDLQTKKAANAQTANAGSGNNNTVVTQQELSAINEKINAIEAQTDNIITDVVS